MNIPSIIIEYDALSIVQFVQVWKGVMPPFNMYFTLPDSALYMAIMPHSIVFHFLSVDE